MESHWSLSDSKSPQVSKTLLGILADLKNPVVWIVSTRPLISKYSSLFTNPLVTVPRSPIIIGITITFMFHIIIISIHSPMRSKRVSNDYLDYFSILSQHSHYVLKRVSFPAFCCAAILETEWNHLHRLPSLN